MIHGKKFIVVMPAYNASATLEQTLREIPEGFVDDVIVVDDASADHTMDVARKLGLKAIRHPSNRGYGGNQKTCYRTALAEGADIVVMLHPDYQYDPRLVVAAASMIASGVYDTVLGSRILGDTALRGGMPYYKYAANRFLTLTQNLLMGTKLSEFHTGYRAFSAEVLRRLPLENNGDDFVFDNQMLAQVVWFGFSIGEFSCPTRYEPRSSSISFRRSVKYGLGVLGTSVLFRLARWGLTHPPMFAETGGRLQLESPRE